MNLYKSLPFTIIISVLMITACGVQTQPVQPPPVETQATEPAAEEVTQQQVPVVQPPPMDDPSLLPVEQYLMYVDNLPVDVDVFREGWSMTYVAGVALDPTIPPRNSGFPPFMFVDFTTPLDEAFPDPKTVFGMDLPQGRIFPVVPYLAMYEEGGSDYAHNAVTGLQQVLAKRTATLDETFHTLPGFGDAQQGVRGNPSYIDFAGGSGVGFVAGYGQEIGPLLNDTLVYQFVGLNDDGTQYVSFVFPLDANFLNDLDTVTDEEIASAEADLQSYLAGVTEQITNAADSDYTPDLSALNAVMQTIVVGSADGPLSEPASDGAAATVGTDPLLADTWTLSGYTDPVDGPWDILATGELYLLHFLPEERVIIMAGCNLINGTYSQEDSSISIVPDPTTLAECGPDSMSERFINLIGGAAIYIIDDHKLRIDLMADGGTMEFNGTPVMEMGDQLSSIATFGVTMGDDDTPPPASAEELAESALSTLVVHEGDLPILGFAKAPGAVVLVDTPDGRILKADGFASVEDQTPMQTSDRLEIGSNSKVFAGILLAQLQEEGVLSLDDQLSQWLPEIAAQLPNGDDITLRQLATHTAGVWDYGNDIIGGGVTNPDLLIKDYTPQEIVDFTIEHGQPEFSPGDKDRWKYSNTGFILLGMVIEAATGQEYGDLLQERIFDPLQMNDSSFLEGVPEPGSIVNGYFIYPFAVNTTDWNGSQGWAAGSIVSTAEDMAIFATGMMHGDIFQDPQTLDVVTEFIEIADNAEVAGIGGIGYGIGLIEFAPGLWGHRGQTAGFTSIIAIDPEQEFIFIALTNSAEGAVGVEQDSIGQFLNIESMDEN